VPGASTETLVPSSAGRVFRSARRIRLSDRDVDGRLRLDAVARYLQDVASDDVDETGWGAPDHLWVIRSIRIEVLEPFLDDRELGLATWCSGLGSVAAGRRTSLAGDHGGSIEVDSVWIHLSPDGKPARLDDRFGVYAGAAGGRRISTRLELPDPPTGARKTPWPLRATDVDLAGHVNNAAYWHAVEHLLPAGGPDPRGPHRALLDYRHPIDLEDAVDLLVGDGDGVLSVGFDAGGVVKAVARIEPVGA
jgi:acyl-ACP thioesterase